VAALFEEETRAGDRARGAEEGEVHGGNIRDPDATRRR
jgi:hypothetical protein